eukprot:823375-Pleurochrysis_carterae.AAC.1
MPRRADASRGVASPCRLEEPARRSRVRRRGHVVLCVSVPRGGVGDLVHRHRQRVQDHHRADQHLDLGQARLAARHLLPPRLPARCRRGAAHAEFAAAAQAEAKRSRRLYLLSRSRG